MRNIDNFGGAPVAAPAAPATVEAPAASAPAAAPAPAAAQQRLQLN